MAIRLDAVSAREKLKPRRDPYWQRVTKGCYLGFRRMSSESQGTWLARARDGNHGGAARNAGGSGQGRTFTLRTIDKVYASA